MRIPVSDVLEIPVPPSSQPGRAGLQGILNGQFRLEKWQRRRDLLATVIVFLSVPLAYLLWDKGGPQSIGAKVVLTAWAVAMLALVCSVEAGRRTAARLDKLVAESGGRRIRYSDRPRDS
jgi:hypothetical protein